MHTINCLVAIGGDLQNKHPRSKVTVPELVLLRAIHGEAAVQNIEVTGNPRINQLDERDRLMRHYPKHQKLVNDIWRDSGGEFPKDVRRLNLNSALFAPAATAQHDMADQLEDEQVAKTRKVRTPKVEPESDDDGDEDLEVGAAL